MCPIPWFILKCYLIYRVPYNFLLYRTLSNLKIICVSYNCLPYLTLEITYLGTIQFVSVPHAENDNEQKFGMVHNNLTIENKLIYLVVSSWWSVPMYNILAYDPGLQGSIPGSPIFYIFIYFLFYNFVPYRA